MLRSSDRLALAHGACVIVEIGDHAAALAALPSAEQHRAAALGPVRGREFVAGRTALHLALATDAAILSDDRGAPVLPPGWVGSIAHKASPAGVRAAALVAPAGGGHLGVDLELAAAPRHDIARRILTEPEQAALPDRGRAVTLRFAIKEAIYKALDPYVRRYVGFTEVELALAGDTVAVATALPFAIEATWREHAGHWLATARAVPR
ncbi:MAG: 4'-phosphopantetheinyl transferase superfamily protein [Deltaproteobacteria bacterium]|nr:MAG: 4'-phosphopantetheinyl transferase superfamily protein [Deltaproteobacteria bacterium]TMQ17780.1 MAG: 4'-phosphopantetheinyl transferase superfamily protein [Deltaproteobacteria bacterium]